MEGLLKIKENIFGIYKNYEYIFKVIGKFIVALLVFHYINTELGFFKSLTGIVPTLFLSAICAVVPVSIFVLIFALVVVLHLYKLSMILAIISLVLFILFDVIYLKFAPKHGILIVLYPVLAQYNLHYMLPIIGAMMFNPFSAIAIACGVLFVKVIDYMILASEINIKMDVQGIMTSCQFIFDKLFSDKEMLVYIAVFTVVVLITYGISRLSFDYSWYVAIAVGTVLNIIGLSVFSFSFEGISIMMVILGSVLGGILAAFFQFMGCTLDYSKKEFLQFEDDAYYYYVKAVPKVQTLEPQPKEKIKKKKEKKSSKKLPAKKQEEEQEDSGVLNEMPQIFEENLSMMSQGNMDEDFDELSFNGFDFDELDRR